MSPEKEMGERVEEEKEMEVGRKEKTLEKEKEREGEKQNWEVNSVWKLKNGKE